MVVVGISSVVFALPSGYYTRETPENLTQESVEIICAVESGQITCLREKIRELSTLLREKEGNSGNFVFYGNQSNCSCPQGGQSIPNWSNYLVYGLSISATIFTALGPLSQLSQNFWGSCHHKQRPTIKDMSWGCIDIIANALSVGIFMVQKYVQGVSIEVWDYISMVAVIVIEALIIGSGVYYRIRLRPGQSYEPMD